MSARQILEHAIDVVEQRGAAYGRPDAIMAAIAARWSLTLGRPVTPAQVTLDFILDERSRELVTEDERRYTLLRTGTWLDRTTKYNPFIAKAIQPRDTLLPIPQDVIDANTGKKMPQNPGF